jgi:hypothetical protein
VRACLVVVGGVGETTNATGLPTAARRSTQRFGDLTFGISFVLDCNTNSTSNIHALDTFLLPYNELLDKHGKCSLELAVSLLELP